MNKKAESLISVITLVICVSGGLAFWWVALTCWNGFIAAAGWHATIAINWGTVSGAWGLCALFRWILFSVRGRG